MKSINDIFLYADQFIYTSICSLQAFKKATDVSYYLVFIDESMSRDKYVPLVTKGLNNSK